MKPQNSSAKKNNRNLHFIGKGDATEHRKSFPLKKNKFCIFAATLPPMACKTSVYAGFEVVADGWQVAAKCRKRAFHDTKPT